jgi:hypothetical protein
MHIYRSGILLDEVTRYTIRCDGDAQDVEIESEENLGSVVVLTLNNLAELAGHMARAIECHPPDGLGCPVQAG